MILKHILTVNIIKEISQRRNEKIKYKLRIINPIFMSEKRPDKCFITNLKTSEADYKNFGWFYKINILNGKENLISLDSNFERWKDDKYFLNNKHLLAGAIINDHQFFRSRGNQLVEISLAAMKQYLPKLDYPKTPDEKIDSVMQMLYSMQSFDGEVVDLNFIEDGPYYYYGNYLKNEEEFWFYFDTLINQKLIVGNDWNGFSKHHNKFSFTIQGLTMMINKFNEISSSKKCFIAMSFSKKTLEIREAIRDATTKSGFIPVIIDEQHIDSDKTINDAIIAELKKAQFCIADFTEQKKGVYFESGFALGQNKKVIYCCQESDFNDTHFDTNHFAHIIYNEPKELEIKLINKIEAWIK